MAWTSTIWGNAVKELLAKRAAAVAKLNDARAKFMAAISVDSPTAEQADAAKKLEGEVVSLESALANIDRQINTQKQIDADALIQQKAEADAEAARIQSERDKRLLDSKGGRISGWDVVTPGSVAEVGKLSTVRDSSVAGNWGFASFGEFAREVAISRKNQQSPTRILNGFNQAASMAAQGMGEAIGADGGHLVPQEFVSKIFERVYATGNLLSRTDIYNISSNTISFPRVNETSRATGSRWGGVQAYWRGEGGSPTLTKPQWAMLKLTLHKLIAMGAATEELLEDSASALDQYLMTCFSREIDFLVSDSIINGTGSGMPLGILNADCTVSVAKETGQAAATINATNLIKMHARLWSGCRQNAVWLINQDIEPQLHTLQIGTGVANQLVYMPPGGLSGLPYATLLGKPVIPVEYCATLGTVGDIILVDLSQWVTAVKSGGPKSAVSMHLYFNTDEQAFRVTYRLDSQPWWPAAVTPYKGSNTQSCAVTLATRA